MNNYYTENELNLNWKGSFGLSKKGSMLSNNSFGGDKLKLQNSSSTVRTFSTSNSLKKLKNLTILKYKVDECLRIMPDKLNQIMNIKLNEKKKEEIKINSYNTNIEVL